MTDKKGGYIICEEDRDLGRLEAEILLAHVLKKDRIWLHAHDTDRLTLKQKKNFDALVSRRRKHEPIAYILGKKEFYGHEFRVTKDTLIPRPDSELLVELAIKAATETPLAPLIRGGHNSDLPLIRGTKGVSVWDAGTGSGAIAISIAKALPHTQVLASDISAKALHVARSNAEQLGAKNVRFIKDDLLGPRVRKTDALHPTPYATFIIVANLPYLPVADKKKLARDVVKFEPSSALFSGKDGLALIKKFLKQIKKLHFSVLFLEYDSPQTKELRRLARGLFPNATITVHKDLAGRDRVLEIRSSLSF